MFFWGERGGFIWDRDENDDKMSQGDLSDVTGQRYCARTRTKMAGGTSNESNTGRKSCDLSLFPLIFVCLIGNRIVLLRADNEAIVNRIDRKSEPLDR